MEFTNNKCYEVCWRGIVVKPGETVNDDNTEQPKKAKKTKR